MFKTPTWFFTKAPNKWCPACVYKSSKKWATGDCLVSLTKPGWIVLKFVFISVQMDLMPPFPNVYSCYLYDLSSRFSSFKGKYITCLFFFFFNQHLKSCFRWIEFYNCARNLNNNLVILFTKAIGNSQLWTHWEMSHFRIKWVIIDIWERWAPSCERKIIVITKHH